MKKVGIHEATEAQLRAFASGTLGLEISPNAKVDTVRAKVQAAWEKPEINVDDGAGTGSDDEVPQGAAPQPVTDKQLGPKDGYVRIIIASDEKSGAEPIPFSVNGKAILIPRGKPVDVHQKYEEALKNCVMHRYEPTADGNGLQTTPREVPVYPYQVIARGAPADLTANSI